MSAASIKTIHALPPTELNSYKKATVSGIPGLKHCLDCFGFTRFLRLFQKLFETKQYKKGTQVVNDILKKYPDVGGKLLNGHEQVILSPIWTWDVFSRGSGSQRPVAHVSEEEDWSFGIHSTRTAKQRPEPVLLARAWHVPSGRGQDWRGHQVISKRLPLSTGKLEHTNFPAFNELESWHFDWLWKGNFKLLLDLSLLEIRIRDLESYRETKHELLRLKPNQSGCWISYAMAFHLLGDLQEAAKIMEQYYQMEPVSGIFKLSKLERTERVGLMAEPVANSWWKRSTTRRPSSSST